MPSRIVLAVSLLVVFGVRGAEPRPVPEIAEVPGPLVIAGGGKLTDDIRDAFFTLAGKEKAKIVVIPTASAAADDPKNAASFLKPWQDLAPQSVVLLHTRDRKKADDPDFVKPLTEATGVWFHHGNPVRLIQAFRGTQVEKELQKLHSRGGAVGGTGEAIRVLSDRMIIRTGPDPRTDAGFSLLPGFVIDNAFDTRLRATIASIPAHVGLVLPENDVGLIIRRRSIRIIGPERVLIHLAAGAGKPAATQIARDGDLFDLFQLRRAAENRAAKEPFPPAKPKEPIVEKGALVIVGGGGATPDIWKRFIELAGGPEAPIVVVPTSMEDPVPLIPAEVSILQRYGAKKITVLHTRDRKEADDPKFSTALLKAKGIWFGGGRQWRFVDSYGGTLTEKRMHDVLARGGVIGGSSAGASIQSEFMPRGHPLGNTVMAAEGYERGFGFLPGCAVDQHFFARKRLADMTGLMRQYPQFLGIGIDEGTAIVVTGSKAEVIGRSKVAFYDYRSRNKADTADETDYEEVKAGEKYDLLKRTKVK